MKPEAHVQTAIDICQSIFHHVHTPADHILNGIFRSHRYIGSKDKKAIADLVYAVLRAYPKYERYIKGDARLLMILFLHEEKYLAYPVLAHVFSGNGYAPAVLTRDEQRFVRENRTYTEAEKLYLPPQLMSYFNASLEPKDLHDFANACQTEASFDIRVNTLKAERETIVSYFNCRGFMCTPTPYSPYGIRFDKRYFLENEPLFKDGTIAVQDEGSQLIATFCNVKPGMAVLDLCAGAGGKTLALAAQMENKGQLYATDIHERRLDQARKRLRCGGVHNVRTYRADDSTFLKRHRSFFDCVLVDAPCSGTGTWRRNPDMKFKTDTTTLDHLIAVQRDILTTAATLVKPGGILVYATCSVFHAENSHQIHWFLQENSDFTCDQLFRDVCVRRHHIQQTDTDGIQLYPHQHKTDGFFMAALRKNGIPI
jgi:16S rRNA (cytosine967-C5)-methyltransferase